MRHTREPLNYLFYTPQGIYSASKMTWAIQREKTPMFVMGTNKPMGYSPGKQGIAGSFVSNNKDLPCAPGILAPIKGNSPIFYGAFVVEKTPSGS